MGKAFVLVGLAIALVGVLVMAGLPLGRLPGDIVIRRGSATFYIPITTCVLLSVVLTVVLSFVRR
ncbi:MAG: DUF2905 family protein [Luteitalea sp.]|nr:DUF2905 family protein [Luteitalea sp.]